MENSQKQEKQPGRAAERGFTFIELVMVIVMIGFLGSIAIQKMLDMARQAEVTAEDTTIEILRSNLLSVMGEQLLHGGKAEFPANPFANLNKVPEGYDPRRSEKPTGLPADDNLWVYVPARDSESLAPQDAGTSLKTFQVDGYIYHQRKDHSVYRWAYDSTRGVISKKFEVPKKELANVLDRVAVSDKE